MKNKILQLLLAVLCSLSGVAQNLTNYVDFEDGTYINNHIHDPSGNIWENNNVRNSYFDSVYHVQFFNDYYNLGYSTSNVPRYALIGDVGANSSNNRVAFANTNAAVNSACTALSDALSDIDNPYNASITNPGCWFLTDDDGDVLQNPKDLIIEYDQTSIQCTIASGYIYDLDNSGSVAEGWQIDVYSTTSTPSTPDNTIYLLANGWSTCTACTSGILASQAYNPSSQAVDGGAAYWEIQTNGDPIDYIVMSYIGDTNRAVGVAFDNFYYCSAGDTNDTNTTEPCDAKANFGYETTGCGTQFTSTSTSASQQIIGYHWNFGDGSTSTEENPYHYYGAPGSYNVSLTVVAFDGKECCSDTVKLRVDVEECLDCQAEIDFYFAPVGEACDACFMNFSAIINYQTSPVIGYYWTIDGVPYTGQNLQHMISGSAYVCLTVVFATEKGQCCTKTICAQVECGANGYASEIGGEPTPHSSNGGKHRTQNTEEADSFGDAEARALSAFPNPSNERLTLQFDLVQSDKLVVELVGIDGKVIRLQAPQDTNEGAQQLSFDISHVPTGIYLARVSGSTVEMSEMISISH